MPPTSRCSFGLHKCGGEELLVEKKLLGADVSLPVPTFVRTQKQGARHTSPFLYPPPLPFPSFGRRPCQSPPPPPQSNSGGGGGSLSLVPYEGVAWGTSPPPVPL